MTAGRAAPGAGRARVVGLSLSLALLSCAERIPMPSTPPPVLDRPSSVIPGDLDVALRVDLVAIERFLGPAARGALALTLADPVEDAPVAAHIAAAFERAEVFWVAFRPGASAAGTDSVVILRGRFAGLDPPADPAGRTGFRRAIDLGGAFRVHERARPARRSAPSRIYARGDDWLVLVSEAEVDSVERMIERRAGDAHVDPPDRGLASAALRAGPVVRLLGPRFPALSILEEAELVEVVAEPAPGGLSVWFSATFPGRNGAPAAALRLKEVVQRVATSQGPWGRAASGASVEEVGETVVVRTLVDAEALAALLGCAAGDSGC